MKNSADDSIGEEYAKREFEAKSLQPKEMRMLVESLQNTIQRRLHPYLLREIELVVAELNELGHDLKLRYDPYPGDIHYRDVNSGSCDLLVACDCVVTVSFGEAIEE